MNTKIPKDLFEEVIMSQPNQWLKYQKIVENKEIYVQAIIDFISGIIIKGGELLKEQPLEYDSNLRDMLARKTYEESGSYAVTPWKVTTDKLTDDDTIPNDDADTRTTDEKRDDYYGVNISPGLGL